MGKPIMYLDEGDNAIPALSLQQGGGAHSITTSATTARNSTAFDSDTRIISVYATQDVYLEFGGSSVEATSSNHFFPAGVYYDFAIPPGVTHVAALQVSTGGTVYISEKE